MRHIVAELPDRSEVTRQILFQLPDPVYRGLASPMLTIEACLDVVLDAATTSNPGRVRDWIDRERSVPADEALIGCLEAVIHRVLGVGVEKQALTFFNRLRSDAKQHVASRRQSDSADASLAPPAFLAAEALVSGIRLHDSDLADHCETTGRFAKRLALHLGCEPGVVARACIAGRLHDLGKLAIDKDLLTKAGPLTAAERNQIRVYPLLGARTIAEFEALQDVAPIVAAHTERVDGTDSLLGPSAPSIPLEARIVAIADAFDTMIAPRRYRKQYTARDAAVELMEQAGKQFDADLVSAFLDMLKFSKRSLRNVAS